KGLDTHLPVISPSAPHTDLNPTALLDPTNPPFLATCLPPASHLPPTCLPPACHLPPTCLPPASHLPATCLPPASHVPATCLPRACHVHGVQEGQEHDA
ncbi:unnamed protein product, partial [Closterium sp. Naga37s-1]